MSSPHPQKPTGEMYFGTVRCSSHPTYQWSISMKNFVHRIPIYSVTVTGSTVMESWDDNGKKGGEIFVHLSPKLQDFWIECPGHSIHFILPHRLFGNIFCPSAFKELCEIHKNACEVTGWSIHYLCLDFTIICSKHKMLIFTLNMPNNAYYVICS